VPRRRIDEILFGKRAITADTDLRLARNFNLSIGLFSALKTDYELKERKRDLKGGSTKNAVDSTASVA
jgi:antitoxin HigA-1